MNIINNILIRMNKKKQIRPLPKKEKKFYCLEIIPKRVNKTTNENSILINLR